MARRRRPSPLLRAQGAQARAQLRAQLPPRAGNAGLAERVRRLEADLAACFSMIAELRGDDLPTAPLDVAGDEAADAFERTVDDEADGEAEGALQAILDEAAVALLKNPPVAEGEVAEGDEDR